MVAGAAVAASTVADGAASMAAARIRISVVMWRPEEECDATLADYCYGVNYLRRGQPLQLSQPVLKRVPPNLGRDFTLRHRSCDSPDAGA